MDPFRGVAVALGAEFPRPRVDPEWLEQCCTWIAEEKELSVSENFQEFFQNVHDQLLKSDLKDSMHHGTGLPEISNMTGNLIGPPVLVQILSIEEIGVSAFQLEQIRAAREERMLAGVGDEEGEDDGDIEVEGEGPMPKYPRGTLHFRLSDGAREFDAMEYRPIPQLVLGVTNLGYKLQLNGTRFSNGMAFLEPTTIKLIGGENAELHAAWDDNFKQGLHARLIGQVAITVGNSPRVSRAPLRDISPQPPTLHDDDIDMEPRRKRPSNVSVNDQPLAVPSNPRSVIPLPTRIRQVPEGSGGGPSSITGPGRKRNTGVISVDPKTPAGTKNCVPNSLGRDRRTSLDFDLLAEEDDDENIPPRPLREKGKERALDQKPDPRDGNVSDYGIEEENMFGDERFWEVLDRVEREALEDERSNNQKVEEDDDTHPEWLSNEQPIPSLKLDVLELDDSDEDANKENNFVPMRHVRRRTEDLSRGRSPAASQNTRQPSSQKKVFINPHDVIDISDSD